MANSDILISAINNYISKSNSWNLIPPKMPFLATIMRNADSSIPADVVFTDADITEASFRLAEKYKGYYGYPDWYSSMYEWLVKRIIVEAKTPIMTIQANSTPITTVSADSIPDETKKSSNTLWILSAVLVILLMSSGKES